MAFRSFARPIPRFGEAFGQSNPLNVDYAAMIANVSPGNLIGYWPLNERTGTVATDRSSTGANGAYSGTVTLVQPGPGNGNVSPLFGGGKVSLATPLAALDTAIGNKSKGTLAAWCKVANAGIWTDSTARFVATFGTDGSNRIDLSKGQAGNNTFTLRYRAGAASKQFDISTSTLLWFHVLLTWDTTVPAYNAYFNSVQQTPQAGALTWTGALAAGFTGIAYLPATDPTNNWAGNLAHIGLWKVALSAAQAQSLFVPAWVA